MHPAVARAIRWTKAALLKHSHLVSEAMSYATSLRDELRSSDPHLVSSVVDHTAAPLFVEPNEVCMRICGLDIIYASV